MVLDTVEEDTEHKIDDYTQVNGEYVLTSSTEATEQRKAEVRAVRNQYLAETDKYTSIPDFPISKEEKANYKSYRQYLRDYTEQESWWESNPKTFEDWENN
jgi:hypothetical protein